MLDLQQATDDEVTEDKQDSEGPKTRKRGGALARAVSAPTGKKNKGEGGAGLGVKSNSSAALAMLAGAAAGNNPAAGAQAAAAAAAAAAQAASTAAGTGPEVWAGMMSSGPAQLGSVPDMSKITAEQAQMMVRPGSG